MVKLTLGLIITFLVVTQCIGSPLVGSILNPAFSLNYPINRNVMVQSPKPLPYVLLPLGMFYKGWSDQVDPNFGSSKNPPPFA